jgi:hypothetical protein
LFTTQFYKHPSGKDGRKPKCKECVDKETLTGVLRECACGCGQKIDARAQYVSGHNLKGITYRSPEHRQKIGNAQRNAWDTTRKRTPLGTKKYDKHGYLTIKTRKESGRWDKEHVAVMEIPLGRKITKEEVIHHINGIRDDNRLENLFLCRDHRHHLQIEHSKQKALGPRLLNFLLNKGIVQFNRESGEYETIL